MEGTLHALTLLAVIVASIAICLCYGRKPEAVVPAFVIVLAALLFVLPLVLAFTPATNIFSGAERGGEASPWIVMLSLLMHQWTILATVPLTLQANALLENKLGGNFYCYNAIYNHRDIDSVHIRPRNAWHSWLTGLRYAEPY